MSSVKIIRNLIIILFLFCIIFIAKEKIALLVSLFSNEQNQFLDKILQYSLQTGLWVLGAFAAKDITNLIFLNRYTSSEQRTGAPKLIKDLLIILIFFCDGLLIMHEVFHQPITGIWITSGALAIILGFALRNIILDLFSGIAVNIEKPYEIGDWIEIHQRFAVESVIGQVTDISWRATHIRTEENTNVVIPNSLMTTMVMTTNFWHKSKPTRYEIKLTLDFSIPTTRAKRILTAGAMEAGQNTGFVIDKTPQILVENANEMGVEYKIRYWITPWQGISPSVAKDIVYCTILKHLDVAGLSPAYPKEDVFTAPMPVRQLDTNNAEDRTKILSQTDLFSMLTQDEIHQLSKALLKRVYMPDQKIVEQEQNGNSMFILLEGLLNVTVLDNGQSIKVGTLSPPDYFGEMSMLTGEKRSATVTSKSASVVFEIRQTDFMNLLSQREEIIEQIADKISQRKFQNSNLIEAERILQKKQAEEHRHSIIYRIRQFFVTSEVNS